MNEFDSVPGLVEIIEIPGSEEDYRKLRVHNKSDRPSMAR